MNHQNHIAAAEEQIVTDRLRRKLDQVNSAAQSQVSTVQDHINSTLQQSYFKCAYECFDRRRKYDEISNCVEYCSVPISNAQNLVGEEMSIFQSEDYGLWSTSCFGFFWLCNSDKREKFNYMYNYVPHVSLLKLVPGLQLNDDLLGLNLMDACIIVSMGSETRY